MGLNTAIESGSEEPGFEQRINFLLIFLNEFGLFILSFGYECLLVGHELVERPNGCTLIHLVETARVQTPLVLHSRRRQTLSARLEGAALQLVLLALSAHVVFTIEILFLFFVQPSVYIFIVLALFFN